MKRPHTSPSCHCSGCEAFDAAPTDDDIAAALYHVWDQCTAAWGVEPARVVRHDSEHIRADHPNDDTAGRMFWTVDILDILNRNITEALEAQKARIRGDR